MPNNATSADMIASTLPNGAPAARIGSNRCLNDLTTTHLAGINQHSKDATETLDDMSLLSAK